MTLFPSDAARKLRSRVFAVDPETTLTIAALESRVEDHCGPPTISAPEVVVEVDRDNLVWVMETA